MLRTPTARAAGLRPAAMLAAALAAAACAPKPAPPAPDTPVALPAPPQRPIPARNQEVLSAFQQRGLDAREEDEGVVIYLPVVYLFAFDSAEVGPQARRQLREIATMLTEPLLASRRVIVEGHADAIGTRDYNLDLSERRASAVRAELVSGGVPAARLAVRALGKERPIEPNRLPDGSDNPEGRARNRRVALVIENPVK